MAPVFEFYGTSFTGHQQWLSVLGLYFLELVFVQNPVTAFAPSIWFTAMEAIVWQMVAPACLAKAGTIKGVPYFTRLEFLHAIIAFHE
jgi:hypothetical protein